ncbi:MAG TPA: MFS transporter [Candidatus Acidoferrum sp.]|nr:MFS transporter [Candidatus Acidoferrum sp.]
MAEKKSKLFYGWWIVFAGALISGAGVGILINCSGVFIKPVTEAMGYSRGGFTLYTTIQSIVAMLSVPVYGEIFRRFSIRKVMFIASVYCCAVYFCLSFATSLWHFYVLGALYGLGNSCITIMAVGTMVNRWFFERKGLAAGLAFSGSGVTAAIMMKVTTAVIETNGWRFGYRVQALVAFALLFVATVFIVKDKPEDIGLVPLGAEKKTADGAPPARLGLTRAQALKTPTFYIMAAGFFLNSMIGMGINPHISACLTDIGYDVSFASTIISVVMLIMMFGKVSLGAMFDKIGSVKAGFTVGFVLLMSSILLYFTELGTVFAWAFALFFGFGYSTLSVPYSYLSSEIFGDREFSRIYSMSTMLSAAGGAIGPVLSGFLFDVTGSYKLVLILYAICSAAVILLLVTAAKQGKARGYATAE